MTEQQSSEVAMTRYECSACTMTATVVDTTDAYIEWHRHMDAHDDPTAFRAWTWTVVPISYA